MKKKSASTVEDLIYKGFEVIYKTDSSINAEPTSYETKPSKQNDMRYVAYQRNKCFGEEFDQIGRMLCKCRF